MHTKGPLSLVEETRHGDRSEWTEIELWSKANNILVCTEVRRAHNDGGRDSMKLLRAAFNSYDKHCGERAVACAEADLLGQALEALEAFVTFHSGHVGVPQPYMKNARAVLALAKGEK